MIGNFKTLAIGLFVLAALGLLMWTTLWVKPTVGDEKQILYVRFTNIDKIIVGTRVLFAGQPVGEVSHIREIRDARVDTIGGRVFIFELTLRIDSNVDVYTTDLITIKTSGLLGERAVDITPMPPQPGKPFERASRDDILFANSGGSVEETFTTINKLSGKAEKVFDQVLYVFKDLENAHFWENLTTGLKNFQEITKSLDRPDELRATVDNFHTFSESLNDSWKKVDKGIEDIAKAAEGFMDVAALAKDIMKGVEDGNGSVGAFLKRDDFYLQTKAIMSKAETLMDDINHYGLLFSSDRRWQRQRERRANNISKLCSPRSFKNYFEDEVNLITTSIERVSAIINESEEKCCLFDCCYERVFADLMRRVGNLSEMLSQLNVEISNDRFDCCTGLKHVCPPCEDVKKTEEVKKTDEVKKTEEEDKK